MKATEIKLYNTKYDDKSNSIVFNRKLMDVLVNIDSQYMNDIKHIVNLHRYIRFDSDGKFNIKKKRLKIHLATCLGIGRTSFYTLFSRLTLKGFLIKHERGIYSYDPEYLVFEERGDMEPYVEKLPSRSLQHIQKANQIVKDHRAKMRDHKYIRVTQLPSALQ